MTSREHTGSLPQLMLSANHPSRRALLSRLVVIMSGGVALGLAWAFSAFSYETIASLEGIRDARASQVTEMYGYWLAALWVTGAICMSISGRRDLSVDGSALQIVLESRALRRFVAAISGVAVATFVIGLALIGVSYLSFVVVTPPAAWLIMSPAGALGAILAVLRFDEYAESVNMARSE